MKRIIIYILISAAFLIIVSFISLNIGPAGISINKIINLLFSSAYKNTAEYSIIFNIRLPRIILGLAVGGALSISGVILQGIFRNPLVEPYTLGISGGAALGVALCIILKLNKLFSHLTMPLFGFLGALIIIIPVYILSTRKGFLKMHSLLLMGIVINSICSSLVMLILAISRTEDLQSIIFWIMGSLGEPSWTLIIITLLISITFLFISYFFCVDLNALLLGEEEAMHLGVNIEKTKKILFFIASLLTGISVSVTGIIGFVGLIIPHFVRLLLGYDHRAIIFISFLLGAGFLILSDTLARIIIAPVELPVGVITGLLGGSVFLYALSKKLSL